MTTAVLDSPVATAADRRAVLHRLLDDALAFGPEHGGGMASHLPMALAALDGLGAHEAQMRSFFAHYARRLRRVELPKGGAKPVDDWKPLRGRIELHETLRASFARAIARDGADAVLHDAVPALVDGVAGAAFHGPIRAAHAVEAGHAGELAAGLAYWAARWEPLPVPGAAAIHISGASAWLDAIEARRITFDPGWRASAPLISARMQQAAVTPPYIELAGALAVDGVAPAALLLDLARSCAARYAATGNFTVLHMATASRALRVLARWLPTRPSALAPLLHAVAAAELAARAAPLQREAIDDEPGWADVRRLACASDDDHVIKLVHAAAMQDAESPDAVWLEAARTAVRG
jgi:hypothetical protein